MYILTARTSYLQSRRTRSANGELEGTLRGHIGVIEEALDRLEGKASEADRGKKMKDASPLHAGV